MNTTIKNNRGFTLGELLITLTILAILLTVAVPAFSALLADNRVVSTTNAVVRMLNLTRSEAITLNQHVLLCKSDKGSQCDHSLGWDQGMLIFHDNNENYQWDSGEKRLNHYAATEPVAISFSAFGSSHWVRYEPDGRSNNGTFTLCLSGAQPRQVIISNTGRPRTELAATDVCAE